MNKKKCISILTVIFLSVSSFAQKNNRIELGRLQTGTTISFIRTADTDWGIVILCKGAPKLFQQKPAKFCVFNMEKEICEIETGYNTIHKTDSGYDALAEIAYRDTVVFLVKDHWDLHGQVVSMHRKVEVLGNAPGGFSSSIVFQVDSSIQWSDLNCLAPGALYGDPTYDGARSPGGTLNNVAHRFLMREDILPAPMFAISFNNSFSVAMLDPSPRCESTVEETKLTKEIMTDKRFQFGTFGTWQENKNPIEFGYSFPVQLAFIHRILLYLQNQNGFGVFILSCKDLPIVMK